MINYFNSHEDLFSGRRDGQVESTRLSKTLSTAISRRKIFDGIFTNEMGLTNMNNIQCDPMEFQVGGINPEIGSLSTVKLFDPFTEQLAIQINKINVDSPINNDDVLHHYATRFHFLRDGGTDCIMSYWEKDLGGGPNIYEKKDPTTWSPTEIYAIPLVDSQHSFNLLLNACNTRATSLIDEEANLSNVFSRRLALREAWINSIVQQNNPHSTDPNYRIISVDFLNKITIESAEMIRNKSYEVNVLTMLSEVSSKKSPNLYEDKGTSGSLPLNELGSLIANLFECSEGIFMPSLLHKNERVDIVPQWTPVESTAGFGTTYYHNGLWTTETRKHNSSGDDYRFFPQHTQHVRSLGPRTEVYVLILNLLPENRVLDSSNMHNYLTLFCIFYPFFWITRDTLIDLIPNVMLDLWFTHRKQFRQIIDIYGSFTVLPHVAFTPETRLNFTSLFGSCSLVIDHAKDVKHNMRKYAKSAAIGFEFTENDTYIIKLLTPGVINIWDQEKSTLNPLSVYIYTQKFGSKPPFKSCSKLNLHVTLYAYLHGG